MSNVNQRDIACIESNRKLQLVAELGQTLGHWTISKVSKPYEDDTDRTWRFVNIETPTGLIFSLSGGSWNKENKIHASIAHIDKNDIKVSRRDVMEYGTEAPDAYISKDKTPEQILKDILRRVVNNPECVTIAEKMKQLFIERSNAQNTLSKHVETLKKLGFYFRESCDGKSYVIDGFIAKLGNVRVFSTGAVHVEFTASISDIPAILKMVNKGE